MPDPIVKDSRLLDIYIWGVDHELLQLHRFSTVEEIISEFCTNKKGKLKVIENLTNIQKKTVAYLLFQRCYVEHRDDYGASEWFEKFSASL